MLYVKIKESQEKDFLKRWNLNNDRIKEIDDKMREKGSLLHRFIYEPYADGKAVYQIIKVNKETVRVRVCTGIGDDWVLPYWGEEARIDKEYAMDKLKLQDWFKK